MREAGYGTNVQQTTPERVDMFNAVQEVQQRLNSVRNRLESINGRVSGYGPENGEACKEIPPSSLRDRIALLCAPLNQIEALVARLDNAVGGDTPKSVSMR